jgi:lipid A 3-O-deacylase
MWENAAVPWGGVFLTLYQEENIRKKKEKMNAKKIIKNAALFNLFLLALTASAKADDAAIVSPYQPVSVEDKGDSTTTTVGADGRINIMEENDYFASHDDRHYTQGARATYLSHPITPNDMWDAPYNGLSSILPIFDGNDRKRKYEVGAGQSIFTPTNTNAFNPSTNDQPYGAWLYADAGLLQESKYQSHDTLENFEVQFGVVGPYALGDVTQNDFHQFIGDSTSQGWHQQLRNEPGVVATYERKWRFEQPLIGNLAVDAIPEIGATGGNIFTYGETGGMVRFGQNLKADYGSDRIRPNLSGTGWFDENSLDGDFGWYLFAGTQGRAVGRNIFLDGNSFESSPSVDKKPLVADFVAGASVFWSKDARVDFTVTQRTHEFYDQQGHPDRFGGLNLAFLFF